MQIDHLYSCEEVGQLLTLKPKTVARRAQLAEWPHVRLPGYGGGYRYVFTEAQLEQIVDMMTVTVTAKTSPRKAPRQAKKTAAKTAAKAS
jgi:hypothetical protein